MTPPDAPLTLLVTGGCGYLGSQLIRDLALDERLGRPTIRILDNLQSGSYQSLMDLPARGRYEFIEGDILDPAAVRLALDGVDAVIHLAAVVSTPMGFDNPAWLQQVNQWGAARLVESCLEAGVQRFIFTSSTAVYGPGGPFDEQSPCRPIGSYAQSKHQAEQSVLAAASRGLQPTILRLSSLFGYAPSMRFQAVANRFAYLAGVGRPLTVYGSGEQKRPLIHIQDASSALRFCLLHDDETAGQIFNVVGENASILDLVEAVRYTRPAAPVHFTSQDVLTHFSFEASGSALADLESGWRPMFTVEAGMAELLARFRQLTPPPPALASLDGLLD